MIRPFTCLAVVLAASSGLYLYTEKHRTTLLDDRIRLVVDDTHRVEDRTSMLRAEWALLNQPDRLQSLAARFLPGLQPIAPAQFVQVADLDKHLPPVAVAPPVVPHALPLLSAPADPGALVASAVPTPIPTVASIAESASASGSGAGAAPLRLASAKEVIAPAPIAVASAAAATDVAEDDPEATPAPAPKRVSLDAKIVPVHAVVRLHKAPPHRPVMVAMSRPAVHDVGAYGTPAPMLATAWRAAPAPWHPASVWRAPSAPASSAFSGSALGMAHMSMAPPVAPAQ